MLGRAVPGPSSRSPEGYHPCPIICASLSSTTLFQCLMLLGKDSTYMAHSPESVHGPVPWDMLYYAVSSVH